MVLLNRHTFSLEMQKYVEVDPISTPIEEIAKNNEIVQKQSRDKIEIKRKLVQVKTVNEIERGDHIVFNRWYGIQHHAIVKDVNLEKKKIRLIEYIPIKEDSSKCEILEKLHDFSEFERTDKYIYEHEFDADTVIRRAESRVGENMYHLYANNCEHFATWAKTGNTFSEQVQDTNTSGLFSIIIGGFMGFLDCEAIQAARNCMKNSEEQIKKIREQLKGNEKTEAIKKCIEDSISQKKAIFGNMIKKFRKIANKISSFELYFQIFQIFISYICHYIDLPTAIRQLTEVLSQKSLTYIAFTLIPMASPVGFLGVILNILYSTLPSFSKYFGKIVGRECFYQLKAVADKILTYIISKMKAFARSINDVRKYIIGKVKDFKMSFDSAVEKMKKSGNKYIAILGNVVEKVTKAVQSFINAVKKVAKVVVETVKKVAKVVVETVKKVAKVVGETVKEISKAAIGAVKTVGNIVGNTIYQAATVTKNVICATKNAVCKKASEAKAFICAKAPATKEFLCTKASAAKKSVLNFFGWY